MRNSTLLQVVVGIVALLAIVVVYNNLSGNGSLHTRVLTSIRGFQAPTPVPRSTEKNITAPPEKTEEELFMERMKKRQDERKALIRETCKRFDIQQNISHMMPMMLVDKKYKVIHCSMGKTGTTRWKELFWQLLGLDKKDFRVQKYQRTKIEAPQREQFLRNSGWIQTMNVREPFERMLSAYRQKLEKATSEFPDRSKAIRAKYGPKDGKLATFSDFINYLVLGAPESLQTGNEHWTRFSYPCTPCAIDYDFIGHQETIGEDARYFLKLIDAPKHITHGPAYTRHSDEEMTLQYYATVEPRERIIQLYSLLLQDYLMFGYPPPKALTRLFGNGNPSWQ